MDRLRRCPGSSSSAARTEIPSAVGSSVGRRNRSQLVESPSDDDSPGSSKSAITAKRCRPRMSGCSASAAARRCVVRSARLARTVPDEIAAPRDAISPRDYIGFAGKYERADVSWKTRTLFRLIGGTRYGDLRDWSAIRAWSDTIARALDLAAASTTAIDPSDSPRPTEQPPTSCAASAPAPRCRVPGPPAARRIAGRQSSAMLESLCCLLNYANSPGRDVTTARQVERKGVTRRCQDRNGRSTR